MVIDYPHFSSQVMLPSVLEVIHALCSIIKITLHFGEEGTHVLCDIGSCMQLLHPWTIRKGQPKEHIVHDSKRPGIYERN